MTKSDKQAKTSAKKLFNELFVDKIVSHKTKNKNPTLYKVAWSDGTTSFEPVEQLYDETDDGTKVFNDALRQYWDDYPELKQRDGFEDEVFLYDDEEDDQ